MPDFDTHKLQDPNEANKGRPGLMATKLKSSLMADKLLSLLMVVAVVAFLLFMAKAIPMAQRIYAFSFPETVTCDQWMLGKAGVCHAPEEGDTVEVCKADSRDKVDDETSCRTPYGTLFCTDGSCFDTMETCRGYQEASSGSRCQPPNFLFRLLGEFIWVIWKASP